MKSLVCLLLLLLCPGWSWAQVSIYASFSASRFSGPNPDWEFGANPGVFFEPWKIPFADAGIDIRALQLGSGNSKLQSALVGPRLRLRPHKLDLAPYGEVLVGAAHVTLSHDSNLVHENGPQFQLVAGVERNVSPRVVWRLAEISWGEVLNVGTRLKTFTTSTGLILRFP